MRRALAASLAVLVLGGCGSSSKPHPAASKPRPRSLDALWHAGGESVGLISGTFDYAPGDVRVSFLVVRHDAKQVVAPRALVHVARSLSARPFERAWASLERTGPNPVFVAHLTIRKPGRYWIVAAPTGSRVRGLGTLDVQAASQSPAIGSKAPPSRTPTIRTRGPCPCVLVPS